MFYMLMILSVAVKYREALGDLHIGLSWYPWPA
jgi:hypothetical protein